MATKAQLEAELAELRAQLAARDAKTPEPAADDHAARTPPHEGDAPAAARAEDAHTVHSALGDFKLEDLEKLWPELAKELDDLAKHKPLLLASFTFLIGYLIGRAR